VDITPYLELKIAPCAVFDALDERASRVRFMVAEGNDWRAVTWGAFAGMIKNAALHLASVGLKMGDRACVFSHNSVEWAAAALGIQAAGGVIVPIYPASTKDQAAYVAAHSDARVIFLGSTNMLTRVLEAWDRYASCERFVLFDEGVDVRAVVELARAKGASLPPFSEIERKMVTWTRAQEIGAACDRENPRAFERTMGSISLDQPGMMLYTSGTSGNPKGVPLTHRNVAVNGLDWLRCNAPLLDDAAIDVLWLPMSHIFGFGEMCLGNTLGFTTYLTDPASALAKLQEVRPSVFMSVPAYWEKLAVMSGGDTKRLAELTGGRLKFCLSGGAGLKREVKELFYSAGLLIIEGYGLTETAPTLTLNRPDAFRFDTVGKPLPSVELKLAEDGEILARGPNVFTGYHKDPVATREAFTPDGWFKTGDVGRFTEDGFLQIIDRKKDILVTAGGKNVPPANIEIRFRDDPFIAQVVVYGDAKKFLVAGVWLNDAAIDAHIAEAGIGPEARDEARRALVQSHVNEVNAQLASYETIKRFCIMTTPLTVEAGLLTASLKIRRKKIYEVFREQFEALYDEPKPVGTALEDVKALFA
jgi:long-chain acyl-CoA synthetase